MKSMTSCVCFLASDEVVEVSYTCRLLKDPIEKIFTFFSNLTCDIFGLFDISELGFFSFFWVDGGRFQLATSWASTWENIWWVSSQIGEILSLYFHTFFLYYLLYFHLIWGLFFLAHIFFTLKFFELDCWITL